MYKEKGPSSPSASLPSLPGQLASREKRCRRAKTQERYRWTLPAQKEEGETGGTASSAALPSVGMSEEKDGSDATVTRAKAVGHPAAASPSPTPNVWVLSGGVSTRGLSLRRKRKAAVRTECRQCASCGDYRRE